MKKLKFRAWDGNVMHENVVIVDNKAYKRGYFANIYSSDSLAGEPMQYTGLKDKNGVEIYEGDVLHINKQFNGVDIYGKVYWKGAGFALITRRGSDTSQGYFEIVTPFTEVIGNIYENPGLLEGETNGQTC